MLSNMIDILICSWKQRTSVPVSAHSCCFEQDGKMKQKTQFTFPIDVFQLRHFKVFSEYAQFSIFYANEQISVTYLVSEPAQGSKSSLRRSVSLTLLGFFMSPYTLSTTGNLTAVFSGSREFVNLLSCYGKRVVKNCSLLVKVSLEVNIQEVLLSLLLSRETVMYSTA